jgi:hypothetical protein
MIQIDEKITELNSLMTLCLPQKTGGGRGASVLDRPTDSLVLLGDLVENENWVYGDEGSIGSLEGEEVLEDREDDGDGNLLPETTLSQDPEILELTSKLSKQTKPSGASEGGGAAGGMEDEDDRMARYALHLERKKKKKKLRTAAYMPNMKSKMYKEWLETQFAKVSPPHSCLFRTISPPPPPIYRFLLILP